MNKLLLIALMVLPGCTTIKEKVTTTRIAYENKTYDVILFKIDDEIGSCTYKEITKEDNANN